MEVGKYRSIDEAESQAEQPAGLEHVQKLLSFIELFSLVEEDESGFPRYRSMLADFVTALNVLSSEIKPDSTFFGFNRAVLINSKKEKLLAAVKEK